MALPELANGSVLEQASGMSDLPLNDPFPEYVKCPYCGELEVEVWCYQARVQCHNCKEWIEHQPPACCGSSPICAAK